MITFRYLPLLWLNAKKTIQFYNGPNNTNRYQCSFDSIIDILWKLYTKSIKDLLKSYYLQRHYNRVWVKTLLITIKTWNIYCALIFKLFIKCFYNFSIEFIIYACTQNIRSTPERIRVYPSTYIFPCYCVKFLKGNLSSDCVPFESTDYHHSKQAFICRLYQVVSIISI